MKDKIVMNILAFIPFTFGLLLCKTETGGFYGNNSGLIGFPLCIASELGIVIWRYYLLVKQLSSDDIKEQSRRSVIINAGYGNFVLCFFSVLFFKSLGADDFALPVLICILGLFYNIPMLGTRKDLKTELICLSVIMLLISFIISLTLDPNVLYSSRHY